MKSQRNFAQQKKTALSDVDLSRKGNIDQYILELLQIVNDSEDLFSTSSCSGRITLFEEISGKKKGCSWLHISHEKVQFEDIENALKESVGNSYIKFEPFVAHIQCIDLDHARRLLSAANAAGYRNSGLTIGKKDRILLAIRSTHTLQVPLSLDGKLIVSNDYIKHVIRLVNEKMDENMNSIDRLTGLIREAINEFNMAKSEINKDTKRKRRQKINNEKSNSYKENNIVDNQDFSEELVADFFTSDP
ncbi:DgyrCDS7036 [Dimorphilus gyrociliatus]|uniref:tRNA wybutosine-synthesizing protein 3 homolog n=1 Tax=Dimorphilus gyrociliatus TaxID=2664684 RepID=A0A7I8VPV9_9ANNE|nr:DgyrCDS7036 [Dimorphilus gyrociliatus]